MPMGIVDDESFELEISSIKQPVDNVVRRPFHGRNLGDNNVPPVIREIIADDEGNTSKELANKFGVSESSVTAYRHGATSTSTYDEPSAPLTAAVNRRQERIAKKSSRALLRTLNKLDSNEFEAKLDSCKPVELSTVAANLSRVVEKTLTNRDAQNIQQNIVFYTPSPLKNDNFEVIDLGRKVIDQK